MEDQKSLSLRSEFIASHTENAISLIRKSDEFNQNYVIYRVKLKPIEVSEAVRGSILRSMDSGKTYVQIGGITLMINTIASIEPIPLKDKLFEEQYQKMKMSFEND